MKIKCKLEERLAWIWTVVSQQLEWWELWTKRGSSGELRKNIWKDRIKEKVGTREINECINLLLLWLVKKKPKLKSSKLCIKGNFKTETKAEKQARRGGWDWYQYISEQCIE